MKITHHIMLLIIVAIIASCTAKPSDVSKTDELPPLFPDYIQVTIPANIAPLNFCVKDNSDAIEVKINGAKDSMIAYGSNEICFDQSKWRDLLDHEAGNTLTVKVTTRINNRWIAYRPFRWEVSKDKIDSYLSYRLIEPGYEVWSDLKICERNLTSFEEKTLANNNQLGQACMNCHIYGNQKGSLSMFHLRGKDGGTILNRNGNLRKLKIKTDNMPSPAVYGAFHPSGKYGVFSTNIIIPAFHSFSNIRMEVYDTVSDIIVADFDHNRIYSSPEISKSNVLETFPVFSPDGKSIYYCASRKVKLPEEIKKLKYSLCRIGFDPATHRFGTKTDTLWNAHTTGKSVCFPRISPDGNYLLFTTANYGTFPIWHRETDLKMIDLRTNKLIDIDIVNSNRSDTYHSWSSNSRWFVFASKRGDGQYGKPYFAYIDKNGKAHKPFVMPVKHPSHYAETLYSYNIPELSATSVPFDNASIEKIQQNTKAEPFR